MKIQARKLLAPNGLRGALGMVACISTLAGCSLGPDFLRPDSGLPDAKLQPRSDYTDSDTTSESSVPVQWWDLFNDAVLTDLETKALRTNLDLQVATSRIEQVGPSSVSPHRSCFLASPLAPVLHARHSANMANLLHWAHRLPRQISIRSASTPVGNLTCGAGHVACERAQQPPWKLAHTSVGLRA